MSTVSRGSKITRPHTGMETWPSLSTMGTNVWPSLARGESGVNAVPAAVGGLSSFERSSTASYGSAMAGV
jgi:hypothetical protein